MDGTRGIYVALIQRALADGLGIYTEPDISPRYDKRGEAHGEITIPRDGPTLNARTQLDVFLAGATDMVEEVCLVAHEWGHHRSPFQEYESIREAVDVDRANGRCTVPIDQRRLIYDEEVRAWRRARELLHSLGFTDSARFEEIAEASLKTYESGLGLSEA